MQQFKDWEAQQMSLAKEPTAELIRCVNCDCSWLEAIQAARFDRNVVSSIGQQPPELTSFTVLKCVRCGELHEPPVNRMFNHVESKIYDEMLDELQQPEEEWGGKSAQKESNDK